MTAVDDILSAAPQHCVLSADQIVLGSRIHCIHASATWREGVLKTSGQADRVVVVKRVLGAGAAVRARALVELLSRQNHNSNLFAGLVDLSLLESFVIVEPLKLRVVHFAFQLTALY